jgi:phosphoribosylamine--glycine ligase
MAKKILVVGGGGREHAIIKALKKSPDCGDLVRTGQRRHQL